MKSKMSYPLARAKVLWTCILLRAMLFVKFTSVVAKQPCLRNVGTLTVTPCGNRLLIKKPLSLRIKSSPYDINPQCSTTALSDDWLY